MQRAGSCVVQSGAFNLVRLRMSSLSTRIFPVKKKRHGSNEPQHGDEGEQAINFNQLTFASKTIHEGGSFLFNINLANV